MASLRSAACSAASAAAAAVATSVERARFAVDLIPCRRDNYVFMIHDRGRRRCVCGRERVCVCFVLFCLPWVSWAGSVSVSFSDQQVTAVVDPADAEPVRTALRRKGYGKIDYILNTHHHNVGRGGEGRGGEDDVCVCVLW